MSPDLIFDSSDMNDKIYQFNFGPIIYFSDGDDKKDSFVNKFSSMLFSEIAINNRNIEKDVAMNEVI